MKDKSFAKRVKSEIGEGSNPAYYKELFKKDIIGLLQWVENSQRAYKRTTTETKNYLQNSDSKGLKNLGLDILDGHFKGILFVLKEIRRRVNS